MNQLLDVSRIEVGKLSLDRSVVELVPLVESIVEGARERTEIHSLTLQSDQGMSLSIDSLRIEQVLINLLDNALKYSPGGGSIKIEVRQPAAHNVRLTITDHGIGIPPHHRSRIFDVSIRSTSNPTWRGSGWVCTSVARSSSSTGEPWWQSFRPMGARASSLLCRFREPVDFRARTGRKLADRCGYRVA